MLIEQRVDGDDLRLVVIDGRVVAAALRMPPEVIGTGEHSVRDLIAAESRRRSAATGGESRIPLDDLTESTIAEAGWTLDDVLPQEPGCGFAAPPTCIRAAPSTTSPRT